MMVVRLIIYFYDKVYPNQKNHNILKHSDLLRSV